MAPLSAGVVRRPVAGVGGVVVGQVSRAPLFGDATTPAGVTDCTPAGGAASAYDARV